MIKNSRSTLKHNHIILAQYWILASLYQLQQQSSDYIYCVDSTVCLLKSSMQKGVELIEQGLSSVVSSLKGER